MAARAYADGVSTTEAKRPGLRLRDVPMDVLLLAGLPAVAGTIHLVAIVQHITEDQGLGVFFLVVGIPQMLAARALLRDPADARMLRLTAAGSLALALLWILSRTVGIPFGPEPGVTKPGVADAIATFMELAFVVLAATLLWRPQRGQRWMTAMRGGLGPRLIPALLSASLFIAAIGGHEH